MQDHDEERMEHRGHDPLRQAVAASSLLTKFWLTNGQKLTPLQRVGYGLTSFVYVGMGLFCLNASIENFKEDDRFMVLFFGVAAVFFLYLGLRGFRNILRFRDNTKDG